MTGQRGGSDKQPTTTVGSPRIVLQHSLSSLKADVFRLEIDGQAIVVKDYSRSSKPIRATVCRLLINRETRALKRLLGITGIPQYLGKHGAHGFRMSAIDGRLPDQTVWEGNRELTDQLAELVKAIHGHGITHNDVRPSNMLFDNNGQLYLLDFAGVFFAPPENNLLFFFHRLLFNSLTRTDLSKAARLKRRFTPERLTAQDLQLIESTRRARGLTKFWKKWVLPFFSVTRRKP